MYVGFSQPYWETYGVLNQKIPGSTAIIVSEKSLSESSKKNINFLYNSFQLKTGRSLFIAKSLSEKNKIIIRSLPKKIAKYFVRASNADTFCFALETQKILQISGFHNFPVF